MEMLLPLADVIACDRDGDEEKQNKDDCQCHILRAEGLSDEFRMHTSDTGEAYITPEDKRDIIGEIATGLHFSTLQSMPYCWLFP